VVRRIQANDKAKDAAKAGTFGAVKHLIDTDGDGRMDKAEVWADRLPPCYGICPARGGVIVACAPDIVFLADRDKDGKAEVRETLFTGFAVGALERGVNAPQWGPDNWIYFGRGHGGGRITGPHLAAAVNLPNTDFRIKSDGSAIEPVTGGTHTIGFTFSAEGERFVTNTQTPAIQIAPLPWRYLARNPDAAVGNIEHRCAADGKTFPASLPHPWRTRRAEDPGFAKFYTDRYGVAESAPNGFFTSACSPLVYQDRLLPGLTGHLLCCEPAQNLIHRGILSRNGLRMELRRPASEGQTEFLASTDPWFHPIALSHSPDGSIWIVDFYREIIEDYSAIPRYLQQQYGLINGHQHGRIWKLTARDAPSSSPVSLGRLNNSELVAELASPLFWRRQTARRLLIERQAKETTQRIQELLTRANDPAIVLNLIYTLDGLSGLEVTQLEKLLAHDAPAVRIHALRASEKWLNKHPSLLDRTFQLARDSRIEVRLQAALTLGEVQDNRVLPTLADLALEPEANPWLRQAVLTSLAGRGDRMLAELLTRERSAEGAQRLLQARRFLESLTAAIAARRDPMELSRAVSYLAAASNAELQAVCLQGILSRFEDATTKLRLDDAARDALKSLEKSSVQRVRGLSRALRVVWQLETEQQRNDRLSIAVDDLRNVQASSESRLAAVAELALERDAKITQSLVDAFDSGTPRVQEAILAALFTRKERLPILMSAIESSAIPAAALNAVQRRALLEHNDRTLRARAARWLAANRRIPAETLERFTTALQMKGDALKGEVVFRAKCATCHRAHGLGAEVGPDLTAEFQRRPETILNDILVPSDSIAAGYATYSVETATGQVFSGVLALETANSLTLRTAEGKEQIVLTKDVERLASTGVSMMPENLADSLQPNEVADVIAFLSRAPEQLVLIDEDPGFVKKLDQGDGAAELTRDDPFSGVASLRITPPQRYSAQIPGWSYRIREHPAAGEFRYLRFAWKAPQAKGVMIELADNGRWPAAESARLRYFSGQNLTGWQAVRVSSELPGEWVVVTRDLWKDHGDCTLTGIAPTAIGGVAYFDRILLLRTLTSTAHGER
jgi:putative membrane-bound dehydrogenase-like protein